MANQTLSVRKAARLASGGDEEETRTWLPSSDAAEVVPQTFDKSTVPLSQGERLYVSKECARDTSIDGDWTFKQKEDAVRWINGVLSTKAHKPVSDLRQLGDGYTLPVLVEVLTRKPVLQGVGFGVDRVGNIQKCLAVLSQNNVQLQGIKADDVADGNVNILLTLCHCLKIGLKMPTKEAWGEPHISPERSLRSAPGSPLSPSTTQAWVDEESSIEQQMSVFRKSESTADKANMVEDKLLSPEVPCIDQQNSADLEDDVLGSDDGIPSSEYVPSDPSKKTRRKSSDSVKSPATTMTPWSKELSSLAGRIERRVLSKSTSSSTDGYRKCTFLSSATNSGGLTRRAKSLPPDHHLHGAERDSPLRQLVPSMRQSVTSGRQTSGHYPRVKTSPLYDLGKHPARKKKVPGKPLHPLNIGKVISADKTDLEVKMSGREFSMQGPGLDRDSIVSIPEFSPTVLKRTAMCLESRPHAPPPPPNDSAPSSGDEDINPPSPVPVSAHHQDSLVQPVAVLADDMSLEQLLQQVSVRDSSSIVSRLLAALVAEVSELKVQQDLLMSSFEEERQILRVQLYQQAKVVHSLVRRGSRPHCRTRNVRALKLHFASLESHVVELARNSAKLTTQLERQYELQEEVKSLKTAVGEQSLPFRRASASDGLMTSPQFADLSPVSSESARASISSVDAQSRQRIDKLTRFFGEEPPLLKKFLQRLGYEKMCSKFDKEKITMLELPYLDEERLAQLGIPMGPRARILYEVQQLKQRAVSPP